jgi:hypothetical protein
MWDSFIKAFLYLELLILEIGFGHAEKEFWDGFNYLFLEAFCLQSRR